MVAAAAAAQLRVDQSIGLPNTNLEHVSGMHAKVSNRNEAEEEQSGERANAKRVGVNRKREAAREAERK